MSKTMVRLSVLIPVKNGEAGILRAIESVRRSLSGQDEILVIDDHSVDQTRALVSTAGPQVRLETSPGHGIVDALNHGLIAARGEYFARCDADDEWLERRLDEEIVNLNRTGALASFAGAVRINPGGTVRAHDLPPQTSNEVRRAMLQSNVLVHGAVVARRAAVLDAGGYRDRPGVEDYDLWMRLMREGDIVTVQELAYRYLESTPAVHRRKRRLQARNTVAILLEHRRATGEVSRAAVARNVLSAWYPGARR